MICPFKRNVPEATATERERAVSSENNIARLICIRMATGVPWRKQLTFAHSIKHYPTFSSILLWGGGGAVRSTPAVLFALLKATHN